MTAVVFCMSHFCVKHFCKFHSIKTCQNSLKRKIYVSSLALQKELLDPVESSEETAVSDVSFNHHRDLTDSSQPLFPEVIRNESPIVSKGLTLRESTWMVTGQFVRMFTSIERYNKWWEDAVGSHAFAERRINWFNERLNLEEGAEWSLCYLILKIGGAFKLVSDDRWIDRVDYIRTPTKKDCTVQAVDLRNSTLNYSGMKYFDNAGFIKYLNVADSILFDDYCLTRCHTLAHSLEYLDISGTSVSPGAFSTLRIFTHLRWLNISRLKNPEQVEALLPFLKEILPRDCVVVHNDSLLALNYGSEIPYRGKNPATDVLLEKNPGIGDLGAFIAEHKFGALETNDVSAVHKLWKTPIVSKPRRALLEVTHPNKHSKFMQFLEYLHRSEYRKPLM